MNEIESRMRDLLRQEENRLDDATLSRLQTARLAALRQRPSRLPRFATPAMLGMALATLVGLAILVDRFNPLQDPVPSEDSRLADSPDLYSDLDFYLWLSESDPGGRG